MQLVKTTFTALCPCRPSCLLTFTCICADVCRRVLPGLLLKGLAAVLPPHMLDQHTSCSSNGDVTGSSSSSISAALLAELRVCAGQELAAAAAGPAGYQGGRQDLPIDLTTAPPLYWPTERVRGLARGPGWGARACRMGRQGCSWDGRSLTAGGVE